MRTHSSSHSQRGFTLIELLAVIAIIGLLSSVILSSLLSARDKAANSRTVSQNSQFAKSLILYADDHDSAYPSTLSGTAINGRSFLCLGEGCVFNNTQVPTKISDSISTYIPDTANTALKEFRIGPQAYQFNGTVFSCSNETDKGCVDGLFFFPFNGNCPRGSLAIMTDSVSSVCMQTIEEFAYNNSQNSESNPSTDDDGDGVSNITDNCPSISNPDQKDINTNGIGDACENFSCQGSFNDSCYSYNDPGTCTDPIRSGCCRWANYRQPTCNGNYSYNCTAYNGSGSQCANHPGCYYEDATQLCYGDYISGSCDYSWDSDTCSIMSGCTYDFGQAGNCESYGPIPQCDWFGEETCDLYADCSWQPTP